ncbi:MAG TPA: 4Fe-4S binding protein [Fibrobacter sp.]|nr:4Fe-4S binding protein [Fibrobacter sp.]
MKKLSHDRKNCIECAGCVGVCPTMALNMFGLDLQIDHEKCTRCGICVRACPVGVLTLVENNDEK